MNKIAIISPTFSNAFPQQKSFEFWTKVSYFFTLSFQHGSRPGHSDIINGVDSAVVVWWRTHVGAYSAEESSRKTWAPEEITTKWPSPSSVVILPTLIKVSCLSSGVRNVISGDRMMNWYMLVFISSGVCGLPSRWYYSEEAWFPMVFFETLSDWSRFLMICDY